MEELEVALLARSRASCSLPWHRERHTYTPVRRHRTPERERQTEERKIHARIILPCSERVYGQHTDT